MTKVILIRHGETLWNAGGRFQGHSDIDLSPAGLRQAQLLAAHFPTAVDAVYASDLQRAVHTAEQIALPRSLPVLVEPRLREISFGLWEGLTYQTIESSWPGQVAAFFEDPQKVSIPEGESFTDVQQRAMSAVREICARHAAQTVVLVAHGGTIRAILADALHMHLRHIWSIKQDNTAMNIIRYDGNRRSVELINGICHLTSQRGLDGD